MVNHSLTYFFCDNPDHLKLSRQPFPFCSLNKQLREYSKILTREKIQLYSNTTWWLEKRLEPALYRQWILFETQIHRLKFYKHFLVKLCAQFFFFSSFWRERWLFLHLARIMSKPCTESGITRLIASNSVTCPPICNALHKWIKLYV